MTNKNIPDPLKAGCITGQNPSTPERLPGHTGYYSDNDSAVAGNEEELGGRPAFLFRTGEWAGVSLDSSGKNLPGRGEPWQLDQYFTLGVRHAVPANLNPEQIIRGVSADGYFVWRTTDPARTAATTQ